VICSKLFLPRETFPLFCKNFGAELFGDFNRFINTFRINYNNLIRPSNRFDSFGNIVLFVESDYAGGYFHALIFSNFE
jgi:hypothetical protein